MAHQQASRRRASRLLRPSPRCCRRLRFPYASPSRPPARTASNSCSTIESLHRELAIHAAEDGMSLNQYSYGSSAPPERSGSP
ncbi:toxin-antitoxin system HicB family antitoxin [Micromonospora parastrephiae]|uniref:toxin-antitoxin system HicB family antitoxin n=1 Tax=Micromonospora parastrephiae TaxID=2806101 RepID=UPI001EE4AA3C|nr:toxin-antitoxin system HicB family antitoxin [Micromonospora parastrephiae]